MPLNVQDTQIELVTPENISFYYRVAGPFRRLLAYLIDLAVRVLIVSLVLMLLVFLAILSAPIARLQTGQFLQGAVVALCFIGAFVLEWFYGGLFEALWNGQTPGKRMMQLRVLSADGLPINFKQALLRNFLRGLDFQPGICCLLGFVTMASNRRFQRLGDLAANTMVVIEDTQRLYGVVRIEEELVGRLARELPPKITIGRELARALSDYVVRRRVLHWTRREEIAKHIGEPMRVRFGLLPGTSYDLILCAIYQKTFLSDNEAAYAQTARAANTHERGPREPASRF